jgi:hypothetical protein
VLIQTHRQEAVSRAYIHAIAARCGLGCSFRDFDYGIDLSVHAIRRVGHRYVESGFNLDIQAKSTTTAPDPADGQGPKARGFMNHSAWVDPRIDRVTVDNVRTYLQNRGWRLQPFPGPELLVFEGQKDDDGEPIVQVLPSSEGLRDYRMRVGDLIGALSAIEGRPAVDILTDMLGSTQTNGAVQPHPEGVNAESK